MSERKFSPTLDVLKEFLEKARKRLSDENPDYADVDEDTGLDRAEWEQDEKDFDDDEDEATKWLRDNDPKAKKKKVEEASVDDLINGEDSSEEEEEQPETGEDEGEEKPEEEDGGEAEVDFEPEITPDKKKPAAWYEEEAAARKRVEEQKAAAALKKPAAAQTVPTPEPTPEPAPAAPAKPVTAVGPIRRKAGGQETPEQFQERWRAGKASQEELEAWLKAHPQRATAGTKPAAVPAGPVAPDDPLQPTEEELNELRQYTLPWERQYRDRRRREATPDKNPHMHHSGLVADAREASVADKRKEFAAYKNSDEFKNSPRAKQMLLIRQWEKNWDQAHPDHLQTTMSNIAAARDQGVKAYGFHDQEKNAQMQHLFSGGTQDQSYSREEGLQHAGLARDYNEELSGGGVSMDGGARFAAEHPDLIEKLRGTWKKKAVDPSLNLDDYLRQQEERRSTDVLGDMIKPKDPEQAAKLNSFVKKYMPTIEYIKNQVLASTNLADHANSLDVDLDTVGLQALYQTMNAYLHHHGQRASFSTLLRTNLNGLFRSALRDEQLKFAPSEVLKEGKESKKQEAMKYAGPVKITDASGTRWVNPDGSKFDPNAPKPAATPEPTPTAPVAPPIKPVGPVKRERSAKEIMAHPTAPPEVAERYQRHGAVRADVPKPQGRGLFSSAKPRDEIQQPPAPTVTTPEGKTQINPEFGFSPEDEGEQE